MPHASKALVSMAAKSLHQTDSQIGGSRPGSRLSQQRRQKGTLCCLSLHCLVRCVWGGGRVRAVCGWWMEHAVWWYQLGRLLAGGGSASDRLVVTFGLSDLVSFLCCVLPCLFPCDLNLFKLRPSSGPIVFSKGNVPLPLMGTATNHRGVGMTTGGSRSCPRSGNSRNFVRSCAVELHTLSLVVTVQQDLVVSTFGILWFESTLHVSEPSLAQSTCALLVSIEHFRCMILQWLVVETRLGCHSFPFQCSLCSLTRFVQGQFLFSLA